MNVIIVYLVLALTISTGTANTSSEGSEEDCFPDSVDCFAQNISPFCLSTQSYHTACSHVYCEPEQFVHDYITRNHDQSPHVNSWKRARVDESATLHDVCLLRNGMPVTRKCQLKKGQAQWESIDHWSRVVCMRRFRERSISGELNKLHDDILEGKRLTNNTQERRRTTALMRNMFTQQETKLLPADVHVASQIFKDLKRQEPDATLAVDLISICHKIMCSNSKVLQLSANLNATSSVLSTFESYVDQLPEQLVPRQMCGKNVPRTVSEADEAAASGVEIVNNANLGVFAQITGNLSVFYVNPACENITGIAIYSSPAANRTRSVNNFWYRFLLANEDVQKLRTEKDLESATYVPEHLWIQLKEQGASYIIFKIYAHDGLFVETVRQRSRKPRSRVLSISIPGVSSKYLRALSDGCMVVINDHFAANHLPQALPFLLRNENHRQPDAQAVAAGSGCGYWDYCTWMSDGVETLGATDLLRDPVIVCLTRHLTQFSFLVGGSYRSNDLGDEILVSPVNERVLDIISIVGCSLSLIGVLGIFLTAALFKSWRNQASTKVLLHLCLAMMLQMVLFVFINTDNVSEELVTHGNITRCVLLGATLQYTILALLCWMLIIAFLQFQRYVTVIGVERPNHYILKAALVAWTFPLLPTVLLACIDPRSYVPSAEQLALDTGICYPSGYGLTFGVVLPVTLITVANLVIFVYVFYSISHSLSQSVQRAERKLIVKQIRLSVLLFFLLGLSWIFGIFAFMQAGVAFSYLFCLTATLQGFVLFVYFVVLDQANRRAWLALLCPRRMEMDVLKRTTEMQSMTTSSSKQTNRSNH